LHSFSNGRLRLDRWGRCVLSARGSISASWLAVVSITDRKLRGRLRARRGTERSRALLRGLARSTKGHLRRELARSRREAVARGRIPSRGGTVGHVGETRARRERGRRSKALSTIGWVEALLELWLLRVAGRSLLSALRRRRTLRGETRSRARLEARGGTRSRHVLFCF
jgi:hypothetical protein